MSDSLKKEVTIVIKSILLANPTRSTLSSLKKTFKGQEGYDIPYSKLGYSKLEDFLRDIPDCLHVVGVGPSAEVRPVVTSKSAHIADLIRNQQPLKNRSGRHMPRAIHTHQDNQIPRFQPKRNCQENVHPQERQQNIPSLLQLPFIARPDTSYRTHEERFQRRNNSQSPSERRHLYQERSQRQDNFQPSERLSQIQRDNALLKSETSEPHPNRLKNHENNRSNQKDQQTMQIRSQEGRFRSKSKYRTERGYEASSSDLSDCGLDQYSSINHKKNKTAQTIIKPRINVCTRGDESFMSDVEAGTEGFENLNYKVPFNVQNNLNDLMYDLKDNGIWFKNLSDIYRSKFGEDLNFQEYGYCSLMEMCLTLRNVFNFKPASNGMCKLYHKSVKPPDFDLYDDFQNLQMSLSEIGPCLTVPAVPNENKIDMLVDETYANMPNDVMQIGQTIERQTMTGKTDGYIEMCIGEIYDPSKFWFYLADSEPIKIDELMDNMQEFYEPRQKEYEIPLSYLQKGQYCAIRFLNEYHRAIILKFMSDSKTHLKAFFFDYGTVSAVSSKGVLYLHNQFAELPMQAMRGRLANICPRHVNEQWSRESATRFLNLIQQKKVVGEVHYFDDKRNVYYLVVADTNGYEDIFINDKLVEENFAIFSTKTQEIDKKIKYKPIVKNLFLFPTFDELELGLVPTALEMIIMLQSHLNIDSIYPQYFRKDKSDDEPSSPEIQELPVNLIPEKFINKNIKKALKTLPNSNKNNVQYLPVLQNSECNSDDLSRPSTSSNVVESHFKPEDFFNRYNDQYRAEMFNSYNEPSQIDYSGTIQQSNNYNQHHIPIPYQIIKPLIQLPTGRIGPPPGFGNVQPNISNLNSMIMNRTVPNPCITSLNPQVKPFQSKPVPLLPLQNVNSYFNARHPNYNYFHFQPKHPACMLQALNNETNGTLVSPLSLGNNKTVHQILHQNNKYVILTEVLRTFHPKLPLVKLKRLIAVNCGAKLETISLTAKPQLKEEIVRLGLIGRECNDVEVVLAVHVPKLVDIQL